MTDAEQLVVELVNRTRADPQAEADRIGIDLNADLAPGTLSAVPRPPLAINAALHDAAFGHSRDILTRNFFDHTNPDGDSPSDRAVASGYPSRSVGENIAQNYVREDDTLTTLAMHEQLFRSSGHRVNMLREFFMEIGTGIDYENSEARFRKAILTEKFGVRSEVFLTGVAFEDADGDDFYGIGEGLEGVTIEAVGEAGTFTTTTGPSGGYSLPIENGVFTVSASSGDLRDLAFQYQVSIDGENFKLDVDSVNDTPIDNGTGASTAFDVTAAYQNGGNPNPFHDGLLIMRYMFGQPDANLEDPKLLPGTATRTTGSAIRSHLDSLGTKLDVNGDGDINPFQDGILILRYLFGQPNANLEVPQLIPVGSTRTTGAELRIHLDSMMPMRDADQTAIQRNDLEAVNDIPAAKKSVSRPTPGLQTKTGPINTIDSKQILFTQDPQNIVPNNSRSKESTTASAFIISSGRAASSAHHSVARKSDGEAEFSGDLGQFDQALLMLQIDPSAWIDS